MLGFFGLGFLGWVFWVGFLLPTLLWDQPSDSSVESAKRIAKWAPASEVFRQMAHKKAAYGWLIYFTNLSPTLTHSTAHHSANWAFPQLGFYIYIYIFLRDFIFIYYIIIKLLNIIILFSFYLNTRCCNLKTFLLAVNLDHAWHRGELSHWYYLPFQWIAI